MKKVHRAGKKLSTLYYLYNRNVERKERSKLFLFNFFNIQSCFTLIQRAEKNEESQWIIPSLAAGIAAET